MATVSGFGFSGTDHPNTIFENMVGRYFGKKRAEDTAALNYAYAQRYAENGPMWSVTGLRKAGLNPILAANGGFSPSMGSAVNVTDNVQSNGGSAGGESPFAITRSNRLANLQAEQVKSSVELNRANAKATTMKAQADVAEANARIKRVNQDFNINSPKERLAIGTDKVLDTVSDSAHALNELYTTPDVDRASVLVNHPDDWKPDDNEIKTYDTLVHEKGKEAALGLYGAGHRVEEWRSRQREFKRTGHHRKSLIFTR